MAMKAVLHGVKAKVGRSKEATIKVNTRHTAKRGTLRYSMYKDTDVVVTLRENTVMIDLCKCPEDEEYNDFLASHVVDFYNRAKLVYLTVLDTDPDSLTRTCNESNCPTMSGGSQYEFLWKEGSAKPASVSAPQYMENLLDYIDGIITDEAVFPTDDSVPFPKNFKEICSKIFRRLYRLFIHVYIEHFERMVETGAEEHTNIFYRHFYFFMQEHKLMQEQDFAPLDELNFKLCRDF